MNTAVILLLIFIVLLFLNIPIAISLAVSGLVCMTVLRLPLDLFPIQIYAGISKFVLLAVPFFILAGAIMEVAGISSKLVRLADTFIGHVKGGLAIVTVITCCFFAAISGSGVATVAALGGFLIPLMEEAGYGKAMPSALLSAAGAIGIIIPPSIPFVIYSSISGQSIAKLFMAGVVPGILMGLGLIIAALFYVRKMPGIKVREKASSAERWMAFKDAIWGLMMPVIILGGIYGGVFTPTEAAAVASIYGLFVGFFVYKSMNLKDLVLVLNRATRSTSICMIITTCGAFFAWFCTTSGISRSATNVLLAVGSNQYVFLLMITIILLIAGCFLETTAALYIFVPVILPVAIKVGYDPIALGVIMVVNLAIGLFTPPVGADLYVACGISKITLYEIIQHIIPYVVASVISLLLITYIPQLILFLPQILGL